MNEAFVNKTIHPDPAASLDTSEAREGVPEGANAAGGVFGASSGQDVVQASGAEMPQTEQTEQTEASLSADALAQLNGALAEVESLREQLLRVRADMDNMRRRQANELEKAHKFALDGFVRELLQVLDSLELAQKAAATEAPDLKTLREGTDLTLKLLSDVMGRFGVAGVDPGGEPFDPTYHQAISTQPRSDMAPNTVVEVVQKGYTLNGRLVRPALVLVSQQAL